tara:strand:+ start:248 stop:505 length:258 start_codon:yes stop_codon:yes gene_type:complete
VKTPILSTPHLIGKHPQHDESLVYSLLQEQRQQQHGLSESSRFLAIETWSSAGASSIFSASIIGAASSIIISSSIILDFDLFGNL